MLCYYISDINPAGPANASVILGAKRMTTTQTMSTLDPLTHDHDQCIARALDEAERLCAQRGVRLTPLRRRVLEEIWQHHEVVKAYDLIHRLSTEDHTVKPPTVYRALDFLLEQGLIHRIESQNGYIGCSHPALAHQCQLLICRGCGQVEELDDPTLSAALQREAESHGFRVDQQIVEVRGLCPHCAPAGADVPAR
jgi:Fur family zinc uptake transcriptional regulator